MKLDFTIITQSLVPKSLVADTKNMLLKYAQHKDRQSLLDEWSSAHCENKLEKFVAYIRKVLVDNVVRLNNNQKAPRSVSNFKEIGSLFSISNQERLAKFLSRQS